MRGRLLSYPTSVVKGVGDKFISVREGKTSSYELVFEIERTCAKATSQWMNMPRSRFIGGLCPQFQNILNLFDPENVPEAHQRALLIERQHRSGSVS